MLAIPISSIAWTVTHEEVFREPREYCKARSQDCQAVWQRKFFYLFTCEYCFSHYVTAFFLVVTRFKLLMDNWMGYVMALFALVWVANIYMSLFARLRVDIRSERAEADVKQQEIAVKEREVVKKDQEIQKLAAELENCLPAPGEAARPDPTVEGPDHAPAARVGGPR
jgi:hypothetical protein